MVIENHGSEKKRMEISTGDVDLVDMNGWLKQTKETDKMKTCPNCNKKLTLEIRIYTNGAENRLTCSCGYHEKHDPFNDDIRNFNSKHCLKMIIRENKD